MKHTSSRPAAVCGLESLETRRHLSLTVKLDYTHDTSNFFAQQQRRDVLQAAVNAVASRINDKFAGITPSAGRSWTVDLSDPSSNGGNGIHLDNPTLTADTIVVYVGAADLGTRAAAEASPGTIDVGSGDAAWNNAIRRRGRPAPEDGLALATPTYGTISFSNAAARNWFFGLDIAGIRANQQDAYSVAQHELGHILGVGLDGAWTQRVRNNAFTGAVSEGVYGGPVPSTTAGGGHLADEVRFEGQPATMSHTSIGVARRESFTRLDFALIDDMGYDVTLPPPMTGKFGSFTGYAYNDANGNGKRDAGEGGFGGIVYVDNNNNGLRDYNEFSVPTDADGRYTVSSVPAGTFRIGLLDPFQQYKTVSPASPYRLYIAADVTTRAADFVGRLAVPPTASVTGSVYNDANRNGNQDAGEKGRGNTTVFLDANANGKFDDQEPRTTTAADGTYRFRNLLGGFYTVYASLTPNASQTTIPVQVSVAAGSSVSGSSTGLYTPTASIAGFSYLDGNRNGVFDAGEKKSAGRKVYIDDNGNESFDESDRSVVTDATGAWRFDNVPASTFRVFEVLGDKDVSTTYYLKYTLVDGQSVSAVAVGHDVRTGGDVGGVVFVDTDRDGYATPNEHVLGGVTVYVDTNNNQKLDSGEARTVSADNGGYSFFNLPNTGAATKLRVVLPAGYEQTTPASGDGFTFGMNAGDEAYGLYFGLAPATTPPADTAALRGVTFNDVNKNGKYDAGDGVAGGKTVFLDANNNGTLDAGEKSIVSGNDGTWAFTGLAASVYRVRRVFPAGYTYSTTPIDVTLAAGQTAAGLAIGSKAGSMPTQPPVTHTASIGGIAFNDVNKNGKYDAGDSVAAGKTIWLDLNDDGVKDANEPGVVTAADGSFTFKNLAAGTYRVRRVFPAGYVESTPARYVTLAAGQVFSGVQIGSRVK